jgi:hypothetical protein
VPKNRRAKGMKGLFAVSSRRGKLKNDPKQARRFTKWVIKIV